MSKNKTEKVIGIALIVLAICLLLLGLANLAHSQVGKISPSDIKAIEQNDIPVTLGSDAYITSCGSSSQQLCTWVTNTPRPTMEDLFLEWHAKKNGGEVPKGKWTGYKTQLEAFTAGYYMRASGR